MRTIRVVTLCSGLDAQCLALRRAGVPFDLVAWSEIDPVAIKAHNAMFPEYHDRNLGDMTKIDCKRIGGGIDLLTYSTPCTDISVAGRKKGLEEGSGTRSSVLWHTEKIIRELRPQYLIQENVRTITTGKMLPHFEKWQKKVEYLGYNNYIALLDAYMFGTPQQRCRMFMVSIRKDVDKGFKFPEGHPTHLRTYDILEGVDVSKLHPSDEVSKCINYNDHVHGYAGIRCLEYRAYDVRCFCPCVTTSFNPLLAIPRIAAPDIPRFPLVKGIDRVGIDQDVWAVRYLTRREALRLMDFDIGEIDKILRLGLTYNETIFVAGNSIAVGTLAAIFEQIWPRPGKQLTLFDF